MASHLLPATSCPWLPLSFLGLTLSPPGLRGMQYECLVATERGAVVVVVGASSECSGAEQPRSLTLITLLSLGPAPSLWVVRAVFQSPV